MTIEAATDFRRFEDGGPIFQIVEKVNPVSYLSHFTRSGRMTPGILVAEAPTRVPTHPVPVTTITPFLGGSQSGLDEIPGRIRSPPPVGQPEPATFALSNWSCVWREQAMGSKDAPPLGIEFQAGHQRVLNLLYNLRNIHKIFIHEKNRPLPCLGFRCTISPEVCGCRFPSTGPWSQLLLAEATDSMDRSEKCASADLREIVQRIQDTEGGDSFVDEYLVDITKVIQQIEDSLVPRLKLDAEEARLYYHLFRHTRLVGKHDVLVSVARLAGAINSSRNLVKSRLRSLQDRGVIMVTGTGWVATRVRVLLPAEIPGVILPAIPPWRVSI